MQVARALRDGSEWFIAALALPLIAAFAWSGRDTLGPLLFALFVGCMLVSPSRKLYATMFVLSLAMELYGTWLGNWIWASRVPWLGLSADNPPLAAGAFYCVLDFLVVSFVAKTGTVPASGKWGLSPFPIQSPASATGRAITASHHAATWSARSSSR
jgi:hypothetical protein